MDELKNTVLPLVVLLWIVFALFSYANDLIDILDHDRKRIVVVSNPEVEAARAFAAELRATVSEEPIVFGGDYRTG